MEILIALVFIAALAALTARLAETRGRNFWVYFVFCFLIPLAILIAVPYLLLSRRPATE